MKQIRRAAVLAALVGSVITLASCGDSTESQSNAPGASSGSARTTPAPSGRDGAVTLTGAPQAVTAGLQAPWSVVFLGDTPLVSERDSGRILELADDGAARVVGTIGGVASGGEGGLLGLAVDEEGTPVRLLDRTER
jgi:glucose/arabinose dehydrogenase